MVKDLKAIAELSSHASTEPKSQIQLRTSTPRPLEGIEIKVFKTLTKARTSTHRGTRKDDLNLYSHTPYNPDTTGFPRR